MSMSKKDFIALADAMAGIRLGKMRSPVIIERDEEIISALLHFMRAQNPNFMAGRWRDYLYGNCGPSGGAVKPEPEDKKDLGEE